MRERSRLMLSITLTVLVHLGFTFYVGNSAATVTTNSAQEVMNFNLMPFTEQRVVPQKTLTAPSKPAKLASKSPIVKKKASVKKVVEKIQAKTFTEKKLLISKEAVQSKEQPVKNNNETRSKISQVETSTQLTPSNLDHENTVKAASIVRQTDNIILQPARFKSLPPPPNYPRRARLRGQQGIALIHARLNAAGEVINTRLAKSSGFSLLDKAAIKAVFQWDFTPGTAELDNAQVWVEIPVEFILNPLKVS